jgi:hypothetical protein
MFFVVEVIPAGVAVRAKIIIVAVGTLITTAENRGYPTTITNYAIMYPPMPEWPLFTKIVDVSITLGAVAVHLIKGIVRLSMALQHILHFTLIKRWLSMSLVGTGTGAHLEHRLKHTDTRKKEFAYAIRTWCRMY